MPDLVITKILETTSNLFFPLIDDMLAISNLEERQNFAHDFKYIYENHITVYRRNKNLPPHFVHPVRKAHGIGIKKKYDSKTQCYKQVPVTRTFTYIPILQTLQFILNNKVVYEYFTKAITYNNCAYTHFVDGTVYKTNSFFQINRNAIQIQLYFDEFEVCNPLGSKTGNHKIGAFYFIINNFPTHINSKLQNIFLAALCYNVNIKKFGINPVLDVIVHDIKVLERQGIFIEFLNTYLKGTLTSISCDNLGGAMLLGMNESFSSHYYCKICTMSKEQAQKACVADSTLLRTTESFIHLSDQQQYANSDTFHCYGVKRKSSLLHLSHFQVSKNLNIDVMHDFLEGICQRDLKLFVEFCNKSGLISLDDFNAKVQAFDYGLCNRQNLPSIIHFSKKSNLIGQRAAQTLCLITFLPLILQDIVPKLAKNFNKWQIILLLIRMLKIILSPTITSEMLNDLRNIIKEHHELVIKEYSVSLTPKDHLIIHYPMIIEKMGPPRAYWTMRFESKNGYFKNLANKLKNFKDIAFTLSVRHQKYIISEWKNKSSFSDEPVLNNFKKECLESINYAKLITEDLNITGNTFIYIGKSVQFKGTKLLLNKFICTSFSEKFPNFGKTKLFFSVNNTMYVLFESWSLVIYLQRIWDTL